MARPDSACAAVKMPAVVCADTTSGHAPIATERSNRDRSAERGTVRSPPFLMYEMLSHVRDTGGGQRCAQAILVQYAMRAMSRPCWRRLRSRQKLSRPPRASRRRTRGSRNGAKGGALSPRISLARAAKRADVIDLKENQRLGFWFLGAGFLGRMARRGLDPLKPQVPGGCTRPHRLVLVIQQRYEIFLERGVITQRDRVRGCGAY